MNIINLNNAEKVIEKLLAFSIEGEDLVISHLQSAEKQKNIIKKLNIFADNFTKWQNKINLVSNSSLSDFWNRHILDSAQLLKFVSRESKTILDLGTGGGFPGLILAIFLSEISENIKVILVDSDARKCAFLMESIRLCNVNSEVICKRIEKINPFSADIITSRAFASLNDFLNYAFPFMSKKTICLALKGETVKEELSKIDSSKYSFNFVSSMTNDSGQVTIIHLAKQYKEKNICLKLY